METLDTTPFHHLAWIALDIETTGFSFTEDRILEIAALAFSPQEGTLDHFGRLVDPGPGIEIPVQVSAIHGITRDVLADNGAVSTAEALDGLAQFLAPRRQLAVGVAHNAPFDLGFLRAEAERSGLPWPSPLDGLVMVDSLVLARKLLRGLTNYKLPTIAQHFGIEAPRGEYHRAAFDSAVLAKVVTRLLEDERIVTWGDVVATGAVVGG